MMMGSVPWCTRACEEPRQSSFLLNECQKCWTRAWTARLSQELGRGRSVNVLVEITRAPEHHYPDQQHEADRNDHRHRSLPRVYTLTLCWPQSSTSAAVRHTD